MPNFSSLSRKEMDQLLELVLSKTGRMSLEQAKAETKREVIWQANDVLSGFLSKRNRLAESLAKYSAGAGIEQIRLSSLQKDFLFDKSLIDDLAEVAKIIINAISTVKFLAKGAKYAIEFVTNNKKLVAKPSPYYNIYPRERYFAPSITTGTLSRGMIHGLAKAARENPKEAILLFLEILGLDWKELLPPPSKLAERITGTNPLVEMEKSLNDLQSITRRVAEHANESLKELDLVIDGIKSKKNDAIRFIEGIS